MPLGELADKRGELVFTIITLTTSSHPTMPSPTVYSQHHPSSNALSADVAPLPHKLTNGPPSLTAPQHAPALARKPHKKRPADRARPERRADEEPRFTTAVPPSSSRRLHSPTNARARKAAPPAVTAPTSSDRLLDVLESPPDYPPPSFQEAISSSSPFFPAPIIPHADVSSHDPCPHSSPHPEPATPILQASTHTPDSASVSDVSSLEFLSLDPSQRWEADRELGMGLDQRVVREYERQRTAESVSALTTPRPCAPNVQLPSTPRSHARCCSHCCSLRPVDIEGEHDSDYDLSMHQSQSSPQRSPLPTDNSDTASAPPSPMVASPTSILGFTSPWASSVTLSLSSVLSGAHRSTTTLKRKESFGVRRLFSKGKERELSPDRPKSELYDWEVVSTSIALDESSDEAGSPPANTRRQTMPAAPPPATRSPTYPREKQKPVSPPSLAFLNRPVRRSQQPGSPTSPTSPASPAALDRPNIPLKFPIRAAPPPPLILGEKKRRPPPPPLPPHRKVSAHNLLTSPSVIWKTPEQLEAMHRQEHAAHSPTSPTASSPQSAGVFSQIYPQSPSLLSALSSENINAVSVPSPIIPRSPASTRNEQPHSHRALAAPLSVEQPASCPATNAAPATPTTPTTPTTPVTPNTPAYHYPGRPLPRPPHESLSSSSSPPVSPRPPVLEKGSPASPSVAAPSSSSPRLELPREFSNFTDLDVLVSRLAEENEETADGRNYEDYLLVSDVLGPGSPSSPAVPAVRPPATRPSNSPAAAHPTSPFVGCIEEERRRVLKNGTVKIKLTLLGATVEKCGICLSQFKSGEAAVLGATCQHAFHERCLRRWLATSRTCPMCRVVISLADYDVGPLRR